jgi:NAD+ synthase (glutamine-hydrolysing)
VPYLRLALAQINPCVGDLGGNADAVIERCRQASQAGADLVLFPEMALTGYPVEDLALRDTFVDASRKTLADLAGRLGDAGLGDLVVLVGYLDRSTEVDITDGAGSRPVDAAAVLHRGDVVCRSAKQCPSDYEIFDEVHIFAPGSGLTVIRVAGVDIALAVGEDLSAEGGRAALARDAGARLLAVINASPYDRDHGSRDRLIRRRAQDAGCPVAYVNCIGGQGEVVFDGDSMIADGNGVIVGRAPLFKQMLLVADLDVAAGQDAADTADQSGDAAIRRYSITDAHNGPDQSRAPQTAAPQPIEQTTYQALLLGLRDYLVKNRFRQVVLGVSGGIDSALVATLACDAIGAGQVCGITNPSGMSPQHSRTDAEELARRTGLQLATIPISGLVDAFQDELDLTGVAAENLQARIRGVIWMAESNRRRGSIVLMCGNSSEAAVGYSTIYGDAVGGFAPIKDVPKTWVWRLAEWRNEQATRRGETPPIPEHTIAKQPSAELRPDQQDTDTLPPYPVLDEILDALDQGVGRSGLLADGIDTETIDRVVSMVDAAEYKRRQYPPGTRIKFRPSGHDRRLPITSRWRETDRS